MNSKDYSIKAHIPVLEIVYEVRDIAATEEKQATSAALGQASFESVTQLSLSPRTRTPTPLGANIIHNQPQL